MLGTASVFGQGSERKVSKFEAGTVLTKEDVGFLDLVANQRVIPAKGTEKSDVKLAGKTYSVGQSLSKEDAQTISASIDAFRKNNPGVSAPSKDNTPPAAITRGLRRQANGAAICWYWYQWCDAWGNCYWYKRWYYC
jgi:hypothetical protein